MVCMWADRCLMYLPNWFIMSATSSLLTDPSLSLSRIWNPSLNIRSCCGCSCESAFPPLTGAGGCDLICTGDPNRGEVFLSTTGIGLERLGSGEVGNDPGGKSLPRRDEVRWCPAFVGDAGGVDWRSGDDAAGDSGLRKGELRGEP